MNRLNFQAQCRDIPTGGHGNLARHQRRLLRRARVSALLLGCGVWLAAMSTPLHAHNTPPTAYPDLAAQVDELKPLLDSYPPKFQNEAELVTTQKRYGVLKKQLDTLLSKQPDEPNLLLLRAELQQLGHNMDVADAFDGAAQDYQHLLAIKPKYVDGLLGFGQLLVNSSPQNAPTAAQLFANAQCVTPTTPNEAAQQGYFFALYYQGQLANAVRQARYNQQQWPNAMYQQLIEVASAALSRAGQAVPTEAASQLPACQP